MRNRGCLPAQLAGIPSLVWDVAGSAETGGTPGSGSTTMGVASPTMGGDIEGSVDTLQCLPAGGGGSLRGNRGRVRLTLGASSSTGGLPSQW